VVRCKCRVMLTTVLPSHTGDGAAEVTYCGVMSMPSLAGDSAAESL
jgi:hypothetical protein